jgi:hypothetical protein
VPGAFLTQKPRSHRPDVFTILHSGSAKGMVGGHAWRRDGTRDRRHRYSVPYPEYEERGLRFAQRARRPTSRSIERE